MWNQWEFELYVYFCIVLLKFWFIVEKNTLILTFATPLDAFFSYFGVG